MFYPNLRQEKKLAKKGLKYIAGVDEAGRGSWAGPIVAAAVIMDPQRKIKGIKDSKLLRSPDRKKLFEEIAESAVAWSISVISNDIIDKIGINQANILAMQQAIQNLPTRPDHILADGLCFREIDIPCDNIINGDYKITSIAAASIVAKVKRDELMDQLDEIYPAYGFKHHKGYGTEHHHHMLMEYGPCKIHRKTFEPIKFLLEISQK